MLKKMIFLRSTQEIVLRSCPAKIRICRNHADVLGCNLLLASGRTCSDALRRSRQSWGRDPCKKRANGISSGLAWFVHVLARVKFFFLKVIFFLDLFFTWWYPVFSWKGKLIFDN
jgi:hypothetical protein